MATFKVLYSKSCSPGGMRNCMEYILRDEKTKKEYIEMLGPGIPDEINWDTAYRSFMDEKKLWNQNSGRMHVHSLISFHKDEKITPEEVLAFARDFAKEYYSGFQVLISVHQDKDHAHAHMVVNTVSFLDGHKYHQNKKDLQRGKELVNDMCKEKGLTENQKGKHFDGTVIEEGRMSSWKKNKFRFLTNHLLDSYIHDCATAVISAASTARDKDEFIMEMESMGWTTTWTDERKHITFENENGDKVRAANISKTFNLNIDKEALLATFELNKPQITEESSIEEILLSYVDVRKAGRKDYGVRKNNEILSKDLHDVSHLIVFAQNHGIKSISDLAYKLRTTENQLTIAKRSHEGEGELYKTIMEAKDASKVMKKYEKVYSAYEHKLLPTSKEKYRKAHLKAIEAYETAEKIVKKSEEYWGDWTLDQKVSVVTDQKKRADAEINPLQTEMKELKEIKKCVLKVLPDAELSLNPMRATITCRMQEAEKKKKEMQVQREREPKKQGRRKCEAER